MEIPPYKVLGKLFEYLNENGYISKERGEYVVVIPKVVLDAALARKLPQKASKNARGSPPASFSDPTGTLTLKAAPKAVDSLPRLFDYYVRQYKLALKQKCPVEAKAWQLLRHMCRKYGIKTVADKVAPFIYTEIGNPIYGDCTITSFEKYMKKEANLGNIHEAKA